MSLTSSAERSSLSDFLRAARSLNTYTTNSFTLLNPVFSIIFFSLMYNGRGIFNVTLSLFINVI